METEISILINEINNKDLENRECEERQIRTCTPPCPMIEPSNHHVNLQDKSGKSLLIHSCARGLKETVDELTKDLNIDPNLEDIEGNTALIHAAQAGQNVIVDLLIERFSNLKLDHTNKLGQTALIKAAIQGRSNCAKILLKAGADPNRRDNGRQLNALEWAEFVGRTECARVIAQFMEPKQKSKMSFNKAHDNLKQVACIAAIPLISGESNKELPASVRPRVRSAPPSPGIKIKITPPSSPLFSAEMEYEIVQSQFPFRAIRETGQLKKRSSSVRPKSSCS